ncbi:sensor histidine kinase [Streptomyces albofaciens JCM 4342]|uniref:sensor histidine kinase n=1 Tax=Streptomyces albofaciens TaxID=66866 RepID=UPI00123C3F45|nr:HAMP domain-containing sensor histidine kinase [Streptomyces albofaciens]KAA6220954.1 sensor histidine kinase [Streptomyces albofaciens JCM 4342]
MRRSLLLLTAATTALVLAALLVPLALLTRSHAADRATADATSRAHSLATGVGQALAGAQGGARGGDRSGVQGAGPGETSDARRVAAGIVDSANGPGLPRTSVVLADGAVLGPATPVTDAVRLARYGRAFTYEPPGGGRTVLVPVQGVAGGTAVALVALTESQLHAGTLASSLEIAGIGAALVLLGLLVADRLGARLVGSARRLSQVADRLAAGDLTARAEPSGPPELRAVAREVNHLADRIDAFLTAERENAADLAHRLRTPVAALRLDAEGLRDPAEAERIAADVAALERSVDEVIRTARKPLREAGRAVATVRTGQGPDPAARRGACADLAAVARERADFWRPLAEDQGRELAFAAPGGPVPVRADPAGLAAAVDALIGNVFDHTPDGAGLRVTVAHEDTAMGTGTESGTGARSGTARLTVEDDGPGFPVGHVPERGHSGGGSTGLGLDIVRRAAEESGGSLECGTAAGGGARVTARFGTAEVAQQDG